MSPSYYGCEADDRDAYNEQMAWEEKQYRQQERWMEMQNDERNMPDKPALVSWTAANGTWFHQHIMQVMVPVVYDKEQIHEEIVAAASKGIQEDPGRYVKVDGEGNVTLDWSRLAERLPPEIRPFHALDVVHLEECDFDLEFAVIRDWTRDDPQALKRTDGHWCVTVESGWDPATGEWTYRQAGDQRHVWTERCFGSRLEAAVFLEKARRHGGGVEVNLWRPLREGEPHDGIMIGGVRCVVCQHDYTPIEPEDRPAIDPDRVAQHVRHLDLILPRFATHKP